MDSRVIIAIVFAFILCGCEWFPNPYSYDLTVTNTTNTSMAVCVHAGVDTLFANCNLEYPLEKKDTRNLGAAGGPWSEIVSRKGGVVFYFYEEKYMGKSDSVRAANVLVRKFYTSVELDSLDWTVIYP